MANTTNISEKSGLQVRKTQDAEVLYAFDETARVLPHVHRTEDEAFLI